MMIFFFKKKYLCGAKFYFVKQSEPPATVTIRRGAFSKNNVNFSCRPDDGEAVPDPMSDQSRKNNVIIRQARA